MSNWISSEYEGCSYHVQMPISAGSLAFLVDAGDVSTMEVIHAIHRSDDMDCYDNLSENILLDCENKYNADASAEFITDKDCYLVWFKERRT